MQAPNIRRQPSKSLPVKAPDPRHEELWQKHQDKQKNQKVVRVPGR